MGRRSSGRAIERHRYLCRYSEYKQRQLARITGTAKTFSFGTLIKMEPPDALAGARRAESYLSSVCGRTLGRLMGPGRVLVTRLKPKFVEDKAAAPVPQPYGEWSEDLFMSAPNFGRYRQSVIEMKSKSPRSQPPNCVLQHALHRKHNSTDNRRTPSSPDEFGMAQVFQDA